MNLPKFILQEPNLVEKTWGGKWIARLKGLDEEAKIGESWEFSSHPSRPSYVLIGKKRVNLIDLLRVAGKEIAGKDVRFLPILVKLLDVSGRLSIQVHPTDDVATLLGEDDRGKDEAWLILDGGRVYIGLKERLEPSELKDLEGFEILEKMNRFEATFLDSFKIPAGTIHCAESIRILEISSNSNLTYRIYGFGETQLDKAIKAMKFGIILPEKIKGERARIRMERFGAEIFEVDGVIETRADGFNILVVVKGDLILRSGRDWVELSEGTSCLIPAVTKVYEMEGKAFACRAFALD